MDDAEKHIQAQRPVILGLVCRPILVEDGFAQMGGTSWTDRFETADVGFRPRKANKGHTARSGGDLRRHFIPHELCGRMVGLLRGGVRSGSARGFEASVGYIGRVGVLSTREALGLRIRP